MTTMHARSAARGYSLVELMVALVLGLLVVGSALSVFLSNRATYSATESLGRTQENARLAFELMSRELREVGSTPCGNTRATVGSVLNNPGTLWYSWDDPVRGYTGAEAIPGVPFGTAPGQRIAGTDALELHGATTGGQKASAHNAGAGTFTMMDAAHGFQPSDIVVVCDYQRASIFQITDVSGLQIEYAAGAGTPGNSTTNLGGCLEIECTPGLYTYQPAMLVTRLGASRWYIGANDRGGNSLFLQTLRNDPATGTTSATTEEIADGVNDLQLTYLLNTNNLYYQNRVVTPDDEYEEGVGANQWPLVLAVRIAMQFIGPEQVGGQDVTRNLTHTVAIRNQNL
jgi:type IV pilus assembly protein PilW